MLTLLLAWISYLYIEQPARRSKDPPIQLIARQYMLPGGALLVLALSAIYPDRIGIPFPTANYQENLAHIRDETRPAYSFEWVCQRQRVMKKDLLDERTAFWEPIRWD